MNSPQRELVRVLFDSQIFSAQRFGGISRYFASLASAMTALPGVTARVTAPFHFNEYLAHLPPDVLKGSKAAWAERLPSLAQLLNLLPERWQIGTFRPDVVHHTYYYPRLGRRAHTRSVLTVYDMIHEKHPEDFRSSATLVRLKAAAIRRADHVICISQQTRRDLLETYPILPERVSVTYLDCDDMDHLLSNDEPATVRRRLLGQDAPYVLYVGARNKYKNFANLFAAYADSPWLRQHFMLLCFGGGPFNEDELQAIRAANLQDRVRQVGGSDAVLAECYRHAAVFVYPSHYEGFGIPPLEAMALGCPVACSNTSSIPEVVGDAAVMFDPADVGAIRKSLETILGSSELRSGLITLGERRRQQFSWRRCAQETIDIYRTLLVT
jgi:glycosyltransferase involved in cell wall biosynthesis